MNRLIESDLFYKNPLEEVCYNFKTKTKDKYHNGSLDVYHYLKQYNIDCTINFNKITKIVWLEVFFKKQLILQVDQHMSVEQFKETIFHLVRECFFKGITIVDDYWWLNCDNQKLLIDFFRYNNTILVNTKKPKKLETI